MDNHLIDPLPHCLQFRGIPFFFLFIVPKGNNTKLRKTPFLVLIIIRRRCDVSRRAIRPAEYVPLLCCFPSLSRSTKLLAIPGPRQALVESNPKYINALVNS